MCVICHGAPGKEQSEISKGLHPSPPDLAEAPRRWNSAQLFWIVKNGIKMTGMPAFGPTHSDNQLWDLVAFVQKLPSLSPDQYNQMQQEDGAYDHEHGPHEHQHGH